MNPIPSGEYVELLITPHSHFPRTYSIRAVVPQNPPPFEIACCQVPDGQWQCTSLPEEERAGAHVPDLHERRWTCATWAQVVDVAVRFFTGAAQIIEPWVIPLHQHPDWHARAVQKAIREAVHISTTDFAAIIERRQQRLAGRYFESWTWWERAQWTQFFTFSHRTDPRYRLYIRRDAQEAYIVSDAEGRPNRTAMHQ